MTDGEARALNPKEALREHMGRMRKGYQDLGEFMLEFSQLEFTIRAVLGAQLKLPAELFDAVTAPYDFASLCKTAEYVLTVASPDKKDDIGGVFSACLKLNQERVRVAHGLWTHGDETIEAKHISRNSLKVGIYFTNPGELKALAGEAQRLLQAVLAIGGESLVFYAEKSPA